MQNFDGMTVIKSKRYLTCLYFIGSLLFVIGGIYMVFNNKGFKGFCGLASIIFFGFCAIKTFLMLIFPEVILAFNNEGFYLKTYDKFIKWNEVSEIYIQQAKSVKMIAINLHNEQDFLNNLSIKATSLFKFNKNLYGYGIFIGLGATGVKFEDMWGLFQSRCTNLIKPEENDINT